MRYKKPLRIVFLHIFTEIYLVRLSPESVRAPRNQPIGSEPRTLTSEIHPDNIIKDNDLLIQMSNASKTLASQFDIETNYKKFQGVIDSVGMI